MVTVAVLLAACEAASPPTAMPTAGIASPASTSSPSPSTAASGPTDADWARVGEAIHLLEVEASGVWTGWGDAIPSMLLEAGDADWLVASGPVADGFGVVPSLEIEGLPVYSRPGHLVPGIGVQDVRGAPLVAMLPRPELQSLVDRLLGKGVVTLDDAQYVRWVTHESFHAFEIRAMGGELPRFGFDDSEAALVERLAKTPGHADAVAREGSLFLDALDAGDDEATIAAIGRFLDARATRRSTADAEVAAFERAVEWSEGLARYADVRLLQAAGAEYTPSAAFLALGASYPDPATTWAAATRWLADLPALPGTLRDWYYEVGAAQAYLLDRVMPGWKERALPGGESLEDLLSQAVETASAGVPVPLRALAIATVHLGSQRLRLAIADTPDGWTRGLEGVRDLGPVDGLLFAFPNEVQAAFTMRGAMIPLDAAFIDTAGRVAAIAPMTLCDADPCPTYGSPVPYRWVLEVPAGRLAGTTLGDALTFDE